MAVDTIRLSISDKKLLMEALSFEPFEERLSAPRVQAARRLLGLVNADKVRVVADNFALTSPSRGRAVAKFHATTINQGGTKQGKENGHVWLSEPLEHGVKWHCFPRAATINDARRLADHVVANYSHDFKEAFEYLRQQLGESQ
jgi:hypothetical protein